MMGVCVEDIFLSFTLPSYDVRKSSTLLIYLIDMIIDEIFSDK